MALGAVIQSLFGATDGRPCEGEHKVRPCEGIFVAGTGLKTRGTLEFGTYSLDG